MALNEKLKGIKNKFVNVTSEIGEFLKNDFNKTIAHLGYDKEIIHNKSKIMDSNGNPYYISKIVGTDVLGREKVLQVKRQTQAEANANQILGNQITPFPVKELNSNKYQISLPASVVGQGWLVNDDENSIVETGSKIVTAEQLNQILSNVKLTKSIKQIPHYTSIVDDVLNETIDEKLIKELDLTESKNGIYSQNNSESTFMQDFGNSKTAKVLTYGLGGIMLAPLGYEILKNLDDYVQNHSIVLENLRLNNLLGTPVYAADELPTDNQSLFDLLESVEQRIFSSSVDNLREQETGEDVFLKLAPPEVENTSRDKEQARTYQFKMALNALGITEEWKVDYIMNYNFGMESEFVDVEYDKLGYIADIDYTGTQNYKRVIKPSDGKPEDMLNHIDWIPGETIRIPINLINWDFVRLEREKMDELETGPIDPNIDYDDNDPTFTMQNNPPVIQPNGPYQVKHGDEAIIQRIKIYDKDAGDGISNVKVVYPGYVDVINPNYTIEKQGDLWVIKGKTKEQNPTKENIEKTITVVAEDFNGATLGDGTSYKNISFDVLPKPEPKKEFKPNLKNIGVNTGYEEEKSIYKESEESTSFAFVEVPLNLINENNKFLLNITGKYNQDIVNKEGTKLGIDMEAILRSSDLTEFDKNFYNAYIKGSYSDRKNITTDGIPGIGIITSEDDKYLTEVEARLGIGRVDKKGNIFVGQLGAEYKDAYLKQPGGNFDEYTNSMNLTVSTRIPLSEELYINGKLKGYSSLVNGTHQDVGTYERHINGLEGDFNVNVTKNSRLGVGFDNFNIDELDSRKKIVRFYYEIGGQNE